MSNVVHSNHRVFSLRSLHHRTFRRLAQMMSNVVHSNHRCWMSTVCLQHHRIIIRTRFHAAACATRTQRITHPNSVPRCCLRHTHSTHHSSELDSTLLPAPHALNASLIRTRFHAAACATRTQRITHPNSLPRCCLRHTHKVGTLPDQVERFHFPDQAGFHAFGDPHERKRQYFQRRGGVPSD
jgi:hypothetical protein